MSNPLNRIRQKLGHGLQRLRQRVHPSPIQFTGDMTIDAAWRAHPRAPDVFARYHLPRCDRCAVRFEERIKEATEAYGIDLDRFLHDLNQL